MSKLFSEFIEHICSFNFCLLGNESEGGKHPYKFHGMERLFLASRGLNAKWNWLGRGLNAKYHFAQTSTDLISAIFFKTRNFQQVRALQWYVTVYGQTWINNQ